MHKVVFIVYPNFELLDMAGPVAVFDGANHVIGRNGGEPAYAVTTVSGHGGPIASSSGVVVDTTSARSLELEGDYTLLVAGAQRQNIIAASDSDFRAWLPDLASKATRLGSVCSGTFVLAQLGLLDGHRAATHWEACRPLAKAFPSIEVDPEALYVVDGRVWTSAGVTTGIDMALAMIGSDLGAVVANEVAKGLVLYARRPGHQSQFSPMLQAQAKAEGPFADLIGWMQENLDQQLDVAALAARSALSERTFHRRFVAATGETPARFVELARLDAARLLLSRGVGTKVVAARVGLAPASRLNDAFKRRFGIAPSLYREMHIQL